MLNYRKPTPDDINIVNIHIDELNRVLSVWSKDYEDPYDLLCFAYYEGCYEPIMARAAPYVVGNSLVNKFSFEWVMIQVDDSWHHGIYHSVFSEPIDLLTLENGDWYRSEPNEELPMPGEITVASLEVITLALKWKRLKGREAPIPEGSLIELEQKVNRASIFG